MAATVEILHDRAPDGGVRAECRCPGCGTRRVLEISGSMCDRIAGGDEGVRVSCLQCHLIYPLTLPDFDAATPEDFL